jgi:hypothetical protein
MDRKVATLDQGGRFLIWAMRNWVFATGERRCALPAIGPAFFKHGMEQAASCFHMAMMILNREALLTLRFAPINCAVVSEDEALLLNLFATAGSDMGGTTVPTLKLMVQAASVPALHRALTGVAGHLHDAGLTPVPPASLANTERKAD